MSKEREGAHVEDIYIPDDMARSRSIALEMHNLTTKNALISFLRVFLDFLRNTYHNLSSQASTYKSNNDA